jgi:hypothetical protein
MMPSKWKSRRWIEISDGFYSCRDHQKVNMTLTFVAAVARAKPAAAWSSSG